MTFRMKFGPARWRGLALVAMTALLTVSFAQDTIPKPGGRSKIKTQIVPLFQAKKSMGFTVVELPSDRYNFSRAEVAVMPSGFAGQSGPTKILYLTYGHRKGGLVRLYEMKAASSLKNGSVLSAIDNSNVFHDSFRDPAYTSKEIVVNGTYVVVGSLKKELVADAIGALKKPIVNQGKHVN